MLSERFIIFLLLAFLFSICIVMVFFYYAFFVEYFFEGKLETLINIE